MPEIVFDVIFIRNISILLAVTLGFLAVSGLPVMALFGQNLARTRQRASYDKCAHQLAVFAVGIGWIMVLGTGFYVGESLLRAHPDLPTLWPDITQGTFSLTEIGRLAAWLSLLCGVFALTLYTILWKSLRNVFVLHQILGLMAALLCYEALYGTLCLVWMETAIPAPPLTRLTDLFAPPLEAGIWNMVPYSLPLAPSVAGGLGALWLLTRRHRDDYGRDHYRQMVPWCAAWARNGWIVTWMLLVAFTAINLWYVHMDTGYLPTRDMRDAALQVMLWCIPLLLWNIVCRSQTPLRHKLTLVLAMVLGSVCLASLTMDYMAGLY